MRDRPWRNVFTALRGASTKQDRMRTHLIYKSNLAYTHTYEDNAQKVDAPPRTVSSSRKSYFTCFTRKLTPLKRFIIFTPRFIITAGDCSLNVQSNETSVFPRSTHVRTHRISSTAIIARLNHVYVRVCVYASRLRRRCHFLMVSKPSHIFI